MAIFGTDVNNLEDLFVEQIKDMYSSEKQVQSSYDKWAGKVGSGELKTLFKRRVDQARARQDELDSIAASLDAKASGHKCKGTEGLLKEGDDFIGDASNDPVLDAGIIANAQRVEHYGIAGYGCAEAYAKQLGHAKVAQTLARMADEAGETNKEMTQIAGSVLNARAATA